MSRAVSVLLIILYIAALASAEALPLLPKDDLPPARPLDTIPLGLDRLLPVPIDNPQTAEKVRLGRQLFFDPILSLDNTISCASCHQPKHGFAGAEARAVGVGGKRGARNAPSLFNRAYGNAFFWDGREATLETQALRPIEDPLEMGVSVKEVVKRLQAHPDYPARFQAVFPDGVTAANLGRALAGFERTLLLGDSKMDRFRAGEIAILNGSERHGLWLFESSGRCWRCHSGPNFTDEKYHNTGVSWAEEPRDLGRYEVTKTDTDRGRFKTPTLRGLTATAPYMHDGSIATLQEVVEYYNRGGHANSHLDPALGPLRLSDEDVKDLVAFLRALSESPAR